MSACPFKVGETYKTRGGWDAKVVHFRGSNAFPMLVVNLKGEGDSISWLTPGGENYGPDSKSLEDLIPPTPPTVRVPLGPEDVPPGSIIRSKDAAARSCHAWCAVSSVTDNALWFHADQRRIEWGDTLHDDDRELSTDGGKTWQPMWKEIPATEGGAP